MRSERLKWLVGLTAVAALAGVLVFFGGSSALQWLLQRALDWVAAAGAWGQVLFVLIYIVATVLLFPRSVLGLGAGALFGVLRGSVLVSLGSTLGATGALARGALAKRLHPVS